ncbi:hypothetical protein C8Q79DRAFT_155326 [Trametes meyenii]|nr:hypothetical protein C8Q79DRAFT_155326 [Trametes meyenii]
MVEICLSVAPILRCQSLTRLEAGILLLPPGIEIIFACVLLWTKRASADKKHVFLASEICAYFVLAVLDLLTHTLPTIGSSLDSFKSLDVFIGVGSFIPLFLYTLFLYLLTSTELVPSLPVRFQQLAKYVLLAFIPLIIVLNELGSFIGISYRSFGGQNGVPLILGVGFTNPTTEMFLSSVTLILLTAFQALNFCIAFYRLVKAFSHQRNIETTDREKKEMEAHLFRGLGWIVAGMKLGAVETVIGFAQGGFGVAFTRRLLRFLGHACLVIGIVKGVDTVEDFQMYSPSEIRRKRKSNLRALIQNPRFSTFRHVGGHDFDAENPFAEKRESVIKLGDPSWMRRDQRKPPTGGLIGEEERVTPGILKTRKSGSLTFKLASRPSFRWSGRKSKGSSIRDSTSSFGSSKRNSWPIANEELIEENEADVRQDEENVVADEFLPPARPRPQPAFPRPVKERVTVHMRHDRLPILQLRRLSDLDFLDLMTDPFRDPHARARSLPGNFEEAEPRAVGHVSASFTRFPIYDRTSAIPPVPAPVRESMTSHHSRSKSLYDRPASARREKTVIVPNVASYNPRDSGVGFPLPTSTESSNPRDTMQSYVPSYNPRDTMQSYVPSYNPRDTMQSYNPRDTWQSYNPRMTMTSYDPRNSTLTYGSRPPSTMDFVAIGSPSTAATFNVPQSALSPHYGGLTRRDRGLSSSTTASDVQAIASQFPGIPVRPTPGPRPRSTLSQQVPLTEFIIEEDEPMPAGAAQVAQMSRAPSLNRKPVPPMNVPDNVSELSTPMYSGNAEKVWSPSARTITEQEATQSLPTPLSPPHTTARWPKRSRSTPAAGKRRPPPLVLSAAVEAGVEPTQSATSGSGSGISEAEVRSAMIRRGSAQGKLMRVKSVGSAPQRSVSASRRTAFARDSVLVQLGREWTKVSPQRDAVDGARYSAFNDNAV